MQLYRANVCDTPVCPFAGGGLRSEAAEGLLVQAGVIIDRGPFASVRERWPQAAMTQLSAGILIPGLIDTHVHYPQVRVTAGLVTSDRGLRHAPGPEAAIARMFAQGIPRRHCGGVDPGRADAAAIG